MGGCWQSLLPLYRVTALIILAVWLGGVLPAWALWPLLVCAVLWWWRVTRLLAVYLLLTALMLYRQSVPELPAASCTFTATVQDFAFAMQPRGQRVPVRVESSADCPPLGGETLMLLDYAEHPLAPGSRWQMRGKVRAEAGLFATLQDARALPPGHHPLLRWRNVLDGHIRARFDDGAARWFQALLLGNRTALQEADRHVLRATGTSHLLAISGLHVALVALMAYWLGKTLWALPYRLAVAVAPRDAGLCFMLIAALGYVLLSGAQAPALRAWLMLLGVSLHWFVPRVQSGLQGLALAACVSLLIDPAMLYAPGAWLSYLATFIVLLAWRRYRAWPALWQWPLLQGWINLALVPLTWAWFGGISLIGFFANLIVIPWLGALLLLGFLACAHAFFVAPAQILLNHYLATLRFFAGLPAAYIEPFWQPATLTAACTYLLVAALLARRYRTVQALFILAALAALWQILPRPALYHSPNGNAAVLHTRAASIVINPGYRYRERDDARRYLLPELRRRGRAPAYILITADKKRAHSALKTLLDAYPGTPVYSLVSLRDFPFATQYCASPPLDKDCTLRTDGYHISGQGIEKTPSAAR